MDAPRSRLGAWLEARVGDPTRPPVVYGGPSWFRVFGAVLVALLAVEVVTGAAMMTVYSPGVRSAWASTFYLQHLLPWGGLVRAMHHWASHALVVTLGLHLVQVLAVKAHRAPREVNWWLGLALAAVVLGFAVTGFPLAWDQKGYWASRVETGIIGTLPVLGPQLQRVVQGGAAYGSLTLTRFYTLHVFLLPGLVSALVGAHLALARRHGLKGPADDATSEATPWWPSQAARDLVAALAAVVTVWVVARVKGVWLDAPADPQSLYPARPEWYFMPLSQLLHHFQGPAQIVGTAVLPGMVGGYLAALPLVDGPSRRGLARVAVLTPLALFAAGAGFLGWELVSHDRRDPGYQRARTAADRQARRAVQLARWGVPPEGPLDMLRNDPASRPRELYAQHCGICHATRGVAEARDAHKGPRLDGFGSRAWATAFVVWPDHPELMGTTEIHDMPPQRRLSDDEVRAVAEWLYAEGVERGEAAPDAALVTRGADIVKERCNQCHLGRLTPSDTESAVRDAPNLDGWGSREWIYEQMVNPHRTDQYGARNHMPRARGKLSERELQMVVGYVRSLRTREAPAVQRPPSRAPAAPAADAAPEAAPTPAPEATPAPAPEPASEAAPEPATERGRSRHRRRG